jgi:hypothetical protein
MITSPSHAIELLGGVKVVSHHTKHPFTTVASWASRQSIPVKVWSALIELAKEKRIKEFTYEALVRAHAGVANRPSRKRDAA